MSDFAKKRPRQATSKDFIPAAKKSKNTTNVTDVGKKLQRSSDSTSIQRTHMKDDSKNIPGCSHLLGSSSVDSSHELKLSTQFQYNLPPLRPSDNHTVMFNYNYIPGTSPSPYPKTYKKGMWNENFVHLPCSPENLCPKFNDSTGHEEVQSCWTVIQQALSNPIRSSLDLEKAILMYNTQYTKKCNFNGLHKLFKEELEPKESQDFFDNLLPKMVNLCLQLPVLCTQPIPLLKSGTDHKISLTQHQIGSLLANAFFCTFPCRDEREKKLEYKLYPGINFTKLFSSLGKKTKNEKLKCLINYFRAITREPPKGIVTFHRQCVTDFPNWRTSEKSFSKLNVRSDGLIEVDGKGMLQVDFADKFIGGKVLDGGCVQEEIRFVMCPELIVSRLFTERLDNNEAFIMTGVEQFNNYSGYSASFKWKGHFNDCIPCDSWGRKLTSIVAIDALHFTRGKDQFEPTKIFREIRKAYAGFLERDVPKERMTPVCTGNWGCGVFKGDPRLKVLIQLISAAESGRDMLYLTFGNTKLKKEIGDVYNILVGKDIKVGQLVRALENYNQVSGQPGNANSLYSYLFNLFAKY